MRVSVVIPCLNEAPSIQECVGRAWRALDDNGISGEVIVADNASEDGSPELAAEAGARVVHEPRRGYGSAYMAGFAAARGEYIVMLDADLTYDFAEIPRFVAELDGGAEFVIGNRMENIHDGAMPWLHRYVGNPIMTRILNVLFRAGIQDVWCGMRGFRRDVLPRLDLRATGMEFALEMVIRASKERLRTNQIAIELHPRLGVSKLSSFRDGWRGLRFMLVHSPTYLFVVPGAAVMLLGLLSVVTVVTSVDLFGRDWQIHALIAGCLLMVGGSQILSVAVCARAYGVYLMGERDEAFERLRRRVRLEHALGVAGALVVAGGIACAVVLATWVDRGFGALSEERLAVIGATLILIGFQVFSSSFLVSILGLRRRDYPAQPQLRSVPLREAPERAAVAPEPDVRRALVAED